VERLASVFGVYACRCAILSPFGVLHPPTLHAVYQTDDHKFPELPHRVGPGSRTQTAISCAGTWETRLDRPSTKTPPPPTTHQFRKCPIGRVPTGSCEPTVETRSDSRALVRVPSRALLWFCAKVAAPSSRAPSRAAGPPTRAAESIRRVPTRPPSVRLGRRVGTSRTHPAARVARLVWPTRSTAARLVAAGGTRVGRPSVRVGRAS
jgi:hypothetical protein